MRTRGSTSGAAGRAHGFTLLEVTVTMAILAVVLVTVYGVFSRTLAAKQYTEARAETAATARAVLTRMVRDLQGGVGRAAPAAPAARARPTPTPNPESSLLPRATQQILFVSRNQIDAGTPLDDLAFSALTRRPTSLNLSAADVAVIRYFIDAAPGDPGRRALYRETIYSLSGRVFDPEKPDPASTVLLLDAVAGLELRFFDGREWVQEWDSTDTRNFAPAPQGVEIALAVLDENGEPQVFRTATDLPMARPSEMPPQRATPVGTPAS